MAFIIKEHRPGRLRLLIVVIVVTWILTGYFLFRFGWERAHTAYDEALAREEALKQEVQQLNDANRELQRQASVLDRSAQVDREAKAEIARTMQDMETQIMELREHVGFYKGIVSPQEGQSGLSVYGLKIMQVDEQLHHFSLVLIQAGKADRVAQGRVSVQFVGVLEKKEEILALKDIDISTEGRMAYKFKYFEKLDGSFRLPLGYYPRSIVVKLLPTGARGKPVSKTFEWAETRSGEL